MSTNHNCVECGIERYVEPSKFNHKGWTGLCGACFNKSRTGELSPWYKCGELINTQGYREVLMPRDDFFYGMANKYNYVREHRLVMAKHLGRCLHRWESVHHKNGDKLDNRIENLELTTKNQHMRDHNNGYRDGLEKGLIDGRKEALKKVVESQKKFAKAYDMRIDGFVIPWEDWQALLKEAEGE